MHIAHWAIYSALGAFIVSVLLCGLLIVACLKSEQRLTRTRIASKAKSMQLQSIIDELNTQHQHMLDETHEQLNIDEQMQASQERHQQLQGHLEMDEHLQPDASLPLRVAALRHSYLSAEKEASENVEHCWRTLDIKLGMLLKQLHSVEQASIPDLASATPEPVINAELMGELQRLRDVTSEQKSQISELEARLNGANSHEEKDALLADMQKQLHQQTRYMQEADTCIQQVEEELTSTCQQLQDITVEHRQVKEYGGELEILIRDFSNTSRDMLQSITILEQENQEMRKKDEAQKDEQQQQESVTDQAA